MDWIKYHTEGQMGLVRAADLVIVDPQPAQQGGSILYLRGISEPIVADESPRYFCDTLARLYVAARPVAATEAMP